MFPSRFTTQHEVQNHRRKPGTHERPPTRQSLMMGKLSFQKKKLSFKKKKPSFGLTFGPRKLSCRKEKPSNGFWELSFVFQETQFRPDFSRRLLRSAKTKPGSELSKPSC